ncbi:MAG TPA: hydroxymethylbilane synthase [Polyangiaceae bacterium]|nr:hydroxymethylbilane synthase [Polyangiaceae bacterium]
MSPSTPLIYATRRSPLALIQCRTFVERLRGLAASSSDTTGALELEELQVITSGDRIQDRSLSDVGGKGLFVKEIEEALLAHRADFAVHSMKDLPAELPPGLVVACIPERHDARDVLIAPSYGSLEALPQGARVGTGSLRRLIALKRHRPDLRVESVRGNVDTRLRKVDVGDYDAVVLARAGLVRLGLEHRISQVLSPDLCLPAVGQGALAIECRQDDTRTRTLLALAHHVVTATCVAAERGVLAAIGGDCKTPLAAYAELVAGFLRLRGFLARPDGSSPGSIERTVPWPASEDEAHRLGRAAGLDLRGA